MADRTLTSDTRLKDLKGNQEFEDLLPELHLDVLDELEYTYWVNTVGDLLQTIVNARRETPLENILHIEQPAIIALKTRLVAALPDNQPAALQAPLNYARGLLLEKTRRSPLALQWESDLFQSTLPGEYSHIADMTMIMDQGHRGTCVACATTAVNEWYHWREDRRQSLSPQHLYCLCKEQDGDNEPGTYNELAVEILVEHGQCTAATLPYNPEFVPGDEAQCPQGRIREEAEQEAESWRAFSMGSIPGSQTQLIKTSLAGLESSEAYLPGRPALFGVPLYPSFLGGETARTGKVLMPLPGELPIGGHAMVLVGYRDGQAPGGGYYIVRNSWGRGWASENPDGPGHCHIPYAYLEQEASGRNVYVFFNEEEHEAVYLLSNTREDQIVAAESSELNLGWTLQDRKPVVLPLEALNRHLVCIGTTGSGKTVFCKLLCEQLLKQGIPVIAVDPQGDLASMSGIISREEAKTKGLDLSTWDYLNSRVEAVVYTPQSNAGIPISANPFSSGFMDGFSKDSPIQYDKAVDLLAEVVVTHLKGLPQTKIPFFQGALVKLLKYALQQGRLQTLEDLVTLLFDPPPELRRTMLKVIEERQIDTLKRSFQVFLDSPSRYLFDYGVPLDMDLLTGRTHNPEGRTRLSILYLNSLISPKDRDYFMSLFLENLHQWMQANPVPEDGLPSLVLFIDEIGNYIPPQNQLKPVCKDILVRIFKEARKYGVICIGASQSPGDFDYRALGQLNAMNIGRLKTPQEYKKIAQILQSDPIPDAEKILTKLEAGEFFLWAPDAFKRIQHFRSRLTQFQLSTLAENDLPKHIPDTLRQRFARFAPQPGQDFRPERPDPKPALPDEGLGSETERQLRHRIQVLETENARLQQLLTDRESEGTWPILSEQDYLVFSSPDKEPEIRIVEHLLCLPEPKIAKEQAEKIFSKDLECSILGQKREDLLDVSLFNYPVWRVRVAFRRKGLFSSEPEEKDLYLDALSKQMLEAKGKRFLFTRVLRDGLDDFKDPFPKNVFQFMDHRAAEVLPAAYQSLIKGQAAAGIIRRKYPHVEVTSACLLLFPFWFAEYQAKNANKVRTQCIDAIYGSQLSPPLMPRKDYKMQK